MAIARWARLDAGIVKGDTGVALAGKSRKCIIATMTYMIE